MIVILWKYLCKRFLNVSLLKVAKTSSSVVNIWDVAECQGRCVRTVEWREKTAVLKLDLPKFYTQHLKSMVAEQLVDYGKLKNATIMLQKFFRALKFIAFYWVPYIMYHVILLAIISVNWNVCQICMYSRKQRIEV